MTGQDIQWYAVRLRPTANRNRSTEVVGGDFETYTDRAGRKRKRRIKGTGQREFVIETLLRKRGFSVFLPTKKVYRRKSKYTKEKRLVAFPLLAGWVFVGWPKGEYRWHDLFACNLVNEVAGIDGRPYPIPQAVMDGMFKRWGGPKTQAPEREQFMRTHHEFKIGDRAKIVEGPFDGQSVDVLDLRGPKAKVLLAFLGGTQVLELDAMQLEAA
jgi:transcription antitermination factor NusG